MRRTGAHYERDEVTFPIDVSYETKPHDGVAWKILGWETEPDEDTEWSGIENRTGRIVARMLGDDTLFVMDREDFAVLPEDQYCYECGQIGCTADGREQ